MKKSRLLSWWNDSVCGPWTENKLLSRKWLTVVGFIFLAIVLDIVGRALQESTIGAVRDVIIAFIGVQGAIDFWRYRTAKKKEDLEERKKEREKNDS